MSKERLEELKSRRKNYNPDVLPIWFEDMDWLIEQAEQTGDLATGYNNAQKEIRILKNQNEQLKEAAGSSKVHLLGLSNNWRIKARDFEMQRNRYLEVIQNIKQTWKKADNIYNHVEMIHEIIKDFESDNHA